MVDMIDNGTGRAVPEWIGATPDARPPNRVRLRILIRHGAKCHLSGIKIKAGDAWDVEHIQALSLGGENRESNMAPALRDKHKTKTAADRKAKAKSDRIRKRHYGIRPKSKFAYSKKSPFKKKLDGTVVRR